MKLSSRLMSTFAGALVRGRLEPLSVGVTRWRVLPGDLDLFGHMNNARYLTIMDLGRVDFLVRLGVSARVLGRRWSMPIGGSHVEFRRALRLFEEYELHTRLDAWDDTWLYLRQEFVEPGPRGRSIGTGCVKTLFRAPTGPIATQEAARTLFDRALPPLEPSEVVAAAFSLRRDAARAPELPATETREPIAIVGIGCRLPGGADGPTRLWEALLEGRDGVVDIPDERWSRDRFWDPSGLSPGTSYVHRAGLLTTDVRAFDAAFFGVPPREAETLDPQQRLLLEVAWEALEDAGIAPDSLRGSRTGVYVGGFTIDNMIIQTSPANRERTAPHTATAASLTMLSNRLSYFLDLRGPSLTIDTACSSSLVAFHMACRAIWSGEIGAALVGGANALLTPEIHVMMSRGRFLSPRGRCHAFSGEADGYVRGEGACVIALKPLSAARRDGNPVYAVVRGTAVNQDGRTHGITLPSVDAQIAVLRDAYADAGVDPSRVAYVEAHGTGTAAGDPIEATALGTVLGAKRRGPPCLVGSIKTNVGHLEAASGVAGIAKAALALRYRCAPANLHFEPPNPQIPFEALRLRVPTGAELLGEPGAPVYAGVNSFGYGGTNAHVVLESADPPAIARAPSTRPLVLPLSAKSPEALAALARGFADRLAEGDAEIEVEAVCRSAAVGRAHHRHRVAAHGPWREWPEALRAFADREGARGVLAEGTRPAEPKVLFVFTGMGPQWWGMGRGLFAREAAFRDAVLSCDAVFRELSGCSIAEEMMAREEPCSRMARTDIAQPANVVLQIALARLFAEWGLEPNAILGHSVGEVAAAQVAGALSLRDALTVALHRSRLQQRAAGRGGMLAVGLSLEDAEERAAGWGPTVSVAAVNSARALTLAGDREALERIAAQLRDEGRFAKLLRVDVPYHGPLMDEIRDELLSSLRALAPMPAAIPLYSTVTGRATRDGTLHDASYWWRNVRDPVRFAAALAAALSDGASLVVEIGPHPTLAPSIREVAAEAGAGVEVVASLRRDADERATMVEGLARLYAAGAPVAWERTFGEGPRAPIPTYPWQHKIAWAESEASRQHRTPALPHPLITDRDGCSEGGWIAALDAREAAYLRDHVVGGAAIVPAAAQVELLLAARAALTGSPACSIEDIELHATIPLEGDDGVKLLVRPASSDPAAKVFSRRGEGAPAACLSAKVFSLGRAPERPAEEASIPLDPAELYRRLAQAGLAYGPRFRAVQSVRVGEGRVTATVTLPEELSSAGYHLHPVLLDAALHSLLAVAASDAAGGTIVPRSIDRVQLFRPCGRSAVVRGALTRVGDGELRGDLTIWAPDQTLVAEVRGLECRVLRPSAAERDARVDRVAIRRVFEPLQLAEPADPSARWHILRPGDPPVPAREADAPPVHLVDLRGIGASAEVDADPVDSALSAMTGLLDTLQALVPGTVARYYVLACGGESVDGEAPSPAAAALLGLARTAMTERPELRVTLVDVDSVPDEAALVERLARLGPEQEVVFRGGAAHVARLTPWTRGAQPLVARRPAREMERFELRVTEPGRLETLAFHACAREPIGPRDVEVEVDLGSLAFKDVMKALGALSHRVTEGTYFGRSLGMEGVGRVTAVGTSVRAVRPGDAVYCCAPGVLRSHVVAPEDYVLKLPDGLRPEDALNLVNMMTAYNSLVRCARLQRGERVVIHGATGGVGLAAIEIARHVGAEMFCTAGTEEKRRTLKELGIAHVGSSRDVTFADDVREWTGGAGADVVLNFSPGEIMRKSLACLAPFGRLIEIGKGSFEQDEALHLRPFNQGLTYAALDFDRALATRPREVVDTYRILLELLAQRAIAPTPTTVFPAGEVSEAFRLMARGRHVGKVAIGVRDPALQVVPDPSPFRADSTYLVTGGLRGFGLALARWMVERGAKSLCLAGRTGEVTPEAAAVLDRLRAQGVLVRTVAVDVADAAAVGALVRELTASPAPLRGVFHAAATYEDRTIAALDTASVDRVLSTKARGAWNLHGATEGLALDHFVLFSSVSALVGNAGQGSYVAANAFVGALAHLRRAANKPALAIDWGVIGDAGAVARDASLGRRLAHLGLHALPASSALDALGAVLSTPVAQLGIVEADWGRVAKMTDPWAGARRYVALSRDTGAGLGPAVAAVRPDLSPEEQTAEVAEQLRGIVGKVMRLCAADLEVDVPLRDLGMDSLVAIEIVSLIEADLRVAVPPMVVVPGPSIRGLARSIVARAGGPRAAPEATT